MAKRKVYIAHWLTGDDDGVAWLQRLARGLEAHGAEAWLDFEVLKPGMKQWDERERMLRKADVVLAVVSKTTFSRGGRTVQEIADHASYHNNVLPVLYDRGVTDLLEVQPTSPLAGLLDDIFPLDMQDQDQFDADLTTLAALLHLTPEPAPPSATRTPPHRLTQLHLRNLKSYGDLTLDLTHPDGTPRAWTCVLADNGCGKTSLLQAIALASLGDTLANKVCDDPNSFVPAQRRDAAVRIEASFTHGDNTLTSGLTLGPRSHDWKGTGAHAATLRRLRDARTKGFFVAAYGSNRRLARAGEVAVAPDPLVDRCKSLFDGQHKLLGLQFGAALPTAALRVAFVATLNQILARGGPGEDLLPELVSVGPAGRGVPGASEGEIAVTADLGAGPFQLGPGLLSSGFQAVLSWVADLLGQLMLDAEGAVDPAEAEGLVLIDEVDLHLHPTWQRRLVPALRAVFPKLQFIVTTHSPLTLTGFEAHEIVRLGLEGGLITLQPAPSAEPGLQTATQLLSTFFDVPHAARPALLEKEREQLALLAQPDRGAQQEARLRALTAELRPHLTTAQRVPLTEPTLADLERQLAAIGSPRPLLVGEPDEVTQADVDDAIDALLKLQ